MLGKPHKQPMDDKYYVAISYFGVVGICLNQISIGASSQQEEEKTQTEGNQFLTKLQTLILHSNGLSKEGENLTDGHQVV